MTDELPPIDWTAVVLWAVMLAGSWVAVYVLYRVVLAVGSWVL